MNWLHHRAAFAPPCWVSTLLDCSPWRLSLAAWPAVLQLLQTWSLLLYCAHFFEFNWPNFKCQLSKPEVSNLSINLLYSVMPTNLSINLSCFMSTHPSSGHRVFSTLLPTLKSSQVHQSATLVATASRSSWMAVRSSWKKETPGEDRRKFTTLTQSI